MIETEDVYHQTFDALFDAVYYDEEAHTLSDDVPFAQFPPAYSDAHQTGWWLLQKFFYPYWACAEISPLLISIRGCLCRGTL